DIWWHLRAGQWIVEHGRLPDTEPFSRMGQETGKPWLAYSWLFEIFVYRLHEWAGLAGLVLYRVVLAALILVSLYHLQARLRPGPVAGAVVLTLAVLTVLPLMTERPWMVSILFSLWVLDAILALREGTGGWWVWLLPVVFMLWANLHIQFV